MSKDEQYMTLALKEAKKAYKKGEVPVGAIIVLDDKVIFKGHNIRESSNDILKHAELIAIKKASRKLKDWRLSNTVMYITLFPCPMCASAILQSRIKKIVIGTPTTDKINKEIVDLIFKGNATSPKIEVIEGILENECKSILSNFFKEKRL